MRSTAAALAVLVPLLAGCEPADPKPAPAVPRRSFPGERRLQNVRQLTFGGENAEAYWSFAGDKLVFQSTRPPYTADQIFVMGADGSDPRVVSTGKGRTTCAYFLPGDRRLVYASTHLGGDAPPEKPPRGRDYVWPVFHTYDIFAVGLDGSDLRRLTETGGYDAEAVVSPKGDRIVFTSARDGDLDVYTMALDGSDVKRLTDEPGYDGGAFFSPDGTKICWRAGRPATEAARAEFKTFLDKGIVRPSQLELWVMNADGTGKTQLTSNGRANFGPSFTPDGGRLIFASNLDDPTSRSFELYLIGLDGRGLERVTYYSNEEYDDFDGFPMFSPDGKHLVWCSNRFNENRGETNVFVADWVE